MPALAEAARDYLGRVEALYPYQALGLVRAGDRFYLLNSRDVEWGERTRLRLLALRLRESYLSAERQAAATPGSAPPAGGFVCLAASRAEREGLIRTPLGEVTLGAGRSLHLVDPQEPQIAVEVKAAPDRPLNLDEIFHRSARTGIYAGLSGQGRGQVRQSHGSTIDTPDGTFIFRVASARRSAVETRVDAIEQGSGPAIDAPRPAAGKPAVAPPVTLAAAAAIESPIAAPMSEPATVPDPVRAVPSARPEPTAVPVLPAAAMEREAASREVSSSSVVAAVATIPVSPAAPIAAEAPSPAQAPSDPPPSAGVTAQARRPAAGQSYEDYARIMKTLMALRRSGSVRSISEITYVHPAVELIRHRR